MRKPSLLAEAISDHIPFMKKSAPVEQTMDDFLVDVDALIEKLKLDFRWDELVRRTKLMHDAATPYEEQWYGIQRRLVVRELAKRYKITELDILNALVWV